MRQNCWHKWVLHIILKTIELKVPQEITFYQKIKRGSKLYKGCLGPTYVGEVGIPLFEILIIIVEFTIIITYN